jgi:NADPH2:quinone reductase
MQSVVLTGPGEVETVQRDRPSAGPGEVVVAVGACGVCMTDYHMYHGTLSVDYPVVPGHESAGEIAETGDGVDGVSPGDRVAVNPSIPCQECSACKRGRTTLCENFRGVGGAGEEVLEGAFAEFVRVPARNLEPIGDLPYRIAAFAEPLACAVHGGDRVGMASGDTVAVVGAGPIGLLLVEVFRNRGAGQIVVSEPIASRRSLATDLGADHAVDPGSVDSVPDRIGDLVGPVDLAVEAVGAAATVEQALELTGSGGSTLVFGVPPEDATVEVSPFDVFYHELTVTGSFSLTPHAFERAVTLLRNDRIAVEPLITSELSLGEIGVAFDRMERNDGLKKVVVPGGG